MALSALNGKKPSTYNRRPRAPFPEIDRLLLAIDAIKPSPRLPADLLSDYRSVLRKLKRWALHMKRLDSRRTARMHFMRWRIRNGAMLAETHDIDKQLAWLLDRKHRGGNVHAMALGKLGAAARWGKHRERKALLALEDAHV